MRTSLALVASSSVLVLLASGCHGSQNCAAEYGLAAPTDTAVGAASSSDEAASRAVSEADIVEFGSRYLYALSLSGDVAIVDVSSPGLLSLVGKTTLPGQPFEMYEVDSTLLAMTNDAVSPSGKLLAADAAAPDVDAGADASAFGSNDGAQLIALDISDPATSVPHTASLDIPGEIADSRIVGNILYIVTYENGSCFRCAQQAETAVTSFDVSTPSTPRKVDQVVFASNAPYTYNAAWGMAWKRSIFANTERMYLGGQAYVPDTPDASGLLQGIIDVVDISDPTGHLTVGTHLGVDGAILNRWQMDETSGVLRVISQEGAGFSGNGTAMPVVRTFQVQSAQSITPLGQTTLTLPEQEGLRSVVFDTSLAYAITFNQTDPLFVIDMSNPAAPRQRGQLSMPGWMFYLAPFGDQVIGLGVDRTDVDGNLNVSLFDVSNPDSPSMLKRVAFGASGIGEDYEILNYELPEDQDRIQKAFKVFDDGTVAVPFSSTSGYSTSGCSSPASGIQLLRWEGTSLTKEPLLPLTGNPRRALEIGGYMVGVSDATVASFAMSPTVEATASASVTIGSCVQDTVPDENQGYGVDDYYPGMGNPGGGACD